MTFNAERNLRNINEGLTKTKENRSDKEDIEATTNPMICCCS